MRDVVYCVACETVHVAPVAVAVNDRCPMNDHTRRCMDHMFLHHAATGGDADCICGSFREQGAADG